MGLAIVFDMQLVTYLGKIITHSETYSYLNVNDFGDTHESLENDLIVRLPIYVLSFQVCPFMWAVFPEGKPSG